MQSTSMTYNAISSREYKSPKYESAGRVGVEVMTTERVASALLRNPVPCSVHARLSSSTSTAA